MPPSDSGSNGDERDVLTSLPRTRPSRRSAKRDSPARGATPPEAPAAAAPSDTPGRAKARAAAKPPTTAAQRPKRATAAKASAPASGARKPKAAASARAKPASGTARSAARKRPARAGTTPRVARALAAAAPEPERPAAEPVVPPAGYATSSSSSGRHGPDPFALVTTSMQAAGEIAQIGATLWSQAIRSALNRFPKP
jgi:hypothetical protein